MTYCLFIIFILFFKINLFILFIYFWPHWVFIAVHGLSLVAASRGHSSLRYMGFSLQWLLLLRSTGSRCAGSVVVARGLYSAGSVVVVHRLSCSMACGIFPDQGSNLCRTSNRALAGGFLTTAPPGKPWLFISRYLIHLEFAWCVVQDRNWIYYFLSGIQSPSTIY